MMIPPRSGELTQAYFKKQKERVSASLNKISSRPKPVSQGHVIPDTNDIAIHDGRRLKASVMFLDICGFSGRPCESEQEQMLMMQILALFFTEMINIVEDYGGVVEKNTGDGLMAYFADNATITTSIQQRAICCALTMFAAADFIINPFLTHSHLKPLDFRICIDHGNITIAKLGVARRFNSIVAVGTTANIASKLLSKAEPNSILAGDNVVSGLPQPWVQNYVDPTPQRSGWVYRENNNEYRCWKYNGRWRQPGY